MPALAFASYSDTDQVIDFHAHRYHELVLVTAGQCELAMGEATLLAAAGSIVVHPAALPHAQRNRGRVRTSYVGFTRPGAFDTAFRVIPLPSGDPVRRWLEDLVIGFREGGGDPPKELGHLLCALLARLGRLEQRAAAAGHPALDAVLSQLEARLGEDQDLRELADLAGCSVGHLGQLARRELGCSVMRWLQERRLELARRLLRDPYRSVGEIAAECGYPDLNYFCRLFRRRFGIAPGRWRDASGAD